jgi:exonuclease SbcC
MRLHSLSIQGFGPFKDKQEIDFDTLSQDKIFMLEGPTGAGKSSIIDAIVYALYGVTAHEAATKSGPAGERVRSDYCQPGDETKVVLEFTASGCRYRVSRTAAYDAPKKSGTGTTPVNAKAILEFISPAHEAIHQVREVNLRIKEELRMDNEQFSQMVVLPQGDFASFLHASTEKRREVLESIFKTYFYEEIEKKVDSRAKEILGELAEQDENITHHVRNLEDEWNSASDPINFEKLREILVDRNLSRVSQNEELNKVVELLRPKGGDFLAKKNALEKELAPLEAQLTLLQVSQTKIENKGKLSAELAELSERSEEYLEKEVRLQARQKVSGLKEILNNRADAEASMNEALEEIEEEFVELNSTQVNARIKELNKELPLLAKKSDEATQAAEKMEELEDSIELSLEYERLVKELPNITSKVTACEKKNTAQKEKIKKYRALEKDTYVLEAAKKLKKGHACPVCGSLEHPNPVKGKHAFDESALLELEEGLSDLENELSDLRSELKEAQGATKKKFKPSVELKKNLKALEKLSEVAEELGDKYKDAHNELDALTSSLPHFVTYENAEKSLLSANTKIHSEMKRLHIEDEEALSKLLEVDEEKLKSEIENYRGRIKEITALLSQPEFGKLPEAHELEMKINEVTEQVNAKKAVLSGITDQLAVLDRVNKSLDAAKLGITFALDQITTLREAGDPFLKLQRWVAGKNLADLSLTNYVLQERLEMILEFASRHLRRMSNGKYEFRLFEEKQGRKQKAGLGITIMDYFAGKERPAETLSGGETFYASLALALGLVEVVKGENGGIELGTLFIDEGFGSLSDDTLEEVLNVLEDLREERIIGIISHVEGMKNQIPMRLEVRPTDQGPSKVTMAVGKMS